MDAGHSRTGRGGRGDCRDRIRCRHRGSSGKTARKDRDDGAGPRSRAVNGASLEGVRRARARGVVTRAHSHARPRSRRPCSGRGSSAAGAEPAARGIFCQRRCYRNPRAQSRSEWRHLVRARAAGDRSRRRGESDGCARSEGSAKFSAARDRSRTLQPDFSHGREQDPGSSGDRRR